MDHFCEYVSCLSHFLVLWERADLLALLYVTFYCVFFFIFAFFLTLPDDDER